MIYKEAGTAVVENFTNDYFTLHDYVLNSGDVVKSRNGDTREVLNFKTQLTNPTHRCIAGHKRNMNIFFLMAESMWIFKGRRDVEFLDIFNSKMKNYSDDGKFFWAPYGWRMRYHGIYADTEAESSNLPYFDSGIDQLKKALQMLSENPADRRIVISIWNPEMDLGTDKKDLPCLSGDTKFNSPEGNLTIKEVYELLENKKIKSYPVYCYDEKNDEVVLKNLDMIVRSGVKKVLKIILKNGSVIKVTPDHRMYKRSLRHKKWGEENFSIVQARELEIGDYLLSDVFNLNPKGHFQHKKKLFRNTSFKNMTTVHRQYYEYINGVLDSDTDIHHINEIKTDNHILNLDMKKHGDHASYHQLKQNSIHNETSIGRTLRAIKQRRTKREKNSNIKLHPNDSKIELYQKVMDVYRANKHKRSNGEMNNIAKIISIEECEPEDVYDFHIPDFHNALFESGVVIHNCNDMLMFKIRDGVLHQTIQNRSNDLNWGLTTNVYQFSFIGEIMTDLLDIRYGTQTHNSQSLHLYVDQPTTIEMQKNYTDPDFDLYSVVKVLPIFCNFREDNLPMAKKLGWVDFYFHGIVLKLMNLNNARVANDEEQEIIFDQELKNFCYHFWCMYKILSIYVNYKKHKDHTQAIADLLKFNIDTGVAVYDFFLLSINFFMARLKEKSSDSFLAQEEIVKALIPNYKNIPLGSL